MNNAPLVSVCMITYNHEKYIRTAIEGVLMQKTIFDIELVIGEDCSTDDTRKICEEYKIKNLEIVRLLQLKVNLGMIPNFKRTLDICKGKYIAFCEGDDYWTDPYKLQKQVDFLEKNPEYGLIHTDSSTFNEEKKNIIKSINKKDKRIVKSGYIFDDLMITNSIHTMTVIARTELVNKALESMRDKFYSFKMGDYPLWLEISKNSKIKYLDEITATYRLHPNSACRPKNIDMRYEFVKSFYQVKFYFCKKYNLEQSVKNSIKQSYYRSIMIGSLIWGSINFIDKEIYKNYNPKTIKEKIIFYASKNNIIWNIATQLYRKTGGFGSPYFIKTKRSPSRIRR